MLRVSLSLLCSIAFALQVLLVVGCGGSSAKTNVGSNSPGAGSGGTGTGSGGSGSGSGGSGSGSGSGSGGGSASTGSSANGTLSVDSNTTICGTPGFGYNNRNGSISGVWMQSPAPGVNPANVTVNASGYSTGTITQWTVCLDGQPAYQTSSSANNISQAITIPSGQHLLWVTVADSKGDSNRSEVHLVTVGAPPAGNATLPTPPANAQVLTEMQNNKAQWSICSLCAAGTNDTSNYTMTFDQSQPSLSGSSMEMYAAGPSWSNVLFMDIMQGTSSKTHFLWDFWVYHDPAAEAHFWSSEFDFWQVLGGNEFMIGSQCDFGDGYWATWDSQNGAWVLNGIPCPHWTAGWHHIQWYDERINTTQYRYDTLVVDGQPYSLNQTWNMNPTTWQDMVGVQYQLDQDTSGTPLHEWIDNVSLTMW